MPAMQSPQRGFVGLNARVCTHQSPHCGCIMQPHQPERTAVNTVNPDRLFVHSRTFGCVESIELSTMPGDLGPAEEIQPQTPPRRRRSDRILARLPSAVGFGIVVAAVIASAFLVFGAAP